MNISKDKLETKNLPDVLHVIQPVLQKHGVDFFLIGAQARDIQLILHGEKAPRATRDLDIALTVPSLKSYNTIKSVLIEAHSFKAVSNETPYRLKHEQTGLLVDLLPFGKISKAGVVQFDDRLKTKMPVAGLKEAYRSAQEVILDNLRLRVATLPGIFVMKLLAWGGDPSGRAKDVSDLKYILLNYFGLNQAEIYHNYFELLETLKPEIAGARVLGVQVKRLLARSVTVRKTVEEILGKNSRDPANSPLGDKMVAGTSQSVLEICALLAEVLKGIQKKHP